MGAPRPRPRTREKLKRADWKKRAVKLAELGWSMRKIARQVGKSVSTVHSALAEELAARRPAPEEVDLMRAKMREQIEAQLKSWIPRSLGGSKDAAMALARFWERLAKLDGLDEPTTQIIATNAGATPAEARQVMRELFGSVGPDAGGDAPSGDGVPPEGAPG